MDVNTTVATTQATEQVVFTGPQVYAAINAVQRELARTGITKDHTTKGFASFKFRGIDDIYNALSPLLARHNLIIAPRFENREFVERVTQKGGALYYITVTGHFDFISVLDGSKHTVTTFGEAMDSGDKGTNKAMSIAYKYACLQVFAIPTEGDNDPDGFTHPPIEPSRQQPMQTQVGQAQKMTAPPLRPAPLEYIAANNEHGKPITSDGRRVFSSEQFQQLEQGILANQLQAEKFMDGDKYYYSQEQINTLSQLSSRNTQPPQIGR